MATTEKGIPVPNGPLGRAAWYHFDACRLVGLTDKARIIELGVLAGHNEGQLRTEWTWWAKTHGKVVALYVDVE
ncbi:hypothetical protein [Rhizobium sp. RAF56]|uniref:hypothetical protein n=1 Tax=Rhizobium sp. RAF56 TaxID=3233062 RepID=UPI003F991B50